MRIKIEWELCVRGLLADIPSLYEIAMTEKSLPDTAMNDEQIRSTLERNARSSLKK